MMPAKIATDDALLEIELGDRRLLLLGRERRILLRARDRDDDDAQQRQARPSRTMLPLVGMSSSFS
jgi:hypothetical protein